MSYATSAEYKTQIKEPGHFPVISCEVVFVDTRILYLTTADFMSADPLNVIFGTSRKDKFDIGLAAMKYVSGTLNNFTGKFDGYDFTGAVLYPKEGLSLTGGSVEWIDLGKFTVDAPVEMGETIKITAVDDMYKFEYSYSHSTLVYPATLEAVFTDVCNLCGVYWDGIAPGPIFGNLIDGNARNDTYTFDGNCIEGDSEIGGCLFDADFGAFTNSDIVIEKTPATETTFDADGKAVSFMAAPSCREMLGMISMLARANAYITLGGQVGLKWYYQQPEPYELDTYKPGTCLVAKNDFVISGLSYSSSNAAQGPVLYGDATAAVYVIDDNLLLDDTNYDPAMLTLAQGLAGFSFRPFSCSSFSDFSNDAGDTVYLTAPDGTRYTTILTNANHSHFSGSEYSADAETIIANQTVQYSPAAKMRAAIATAINLGNNAYKIANGKNTVYYMTTEPTGDMYILGDIWFDTDAGNKMHVHNGTSWIASQFGTPAFAAASITADQLAAASVIAGKIAAGVVTALEIAANSITADKLLANTITAASGVIHDITADVITAGILKSVGNESSINLANGQFSFANGKMIYDGTELALKGTFETSYSVDPRSLEISGYAAKWKASGVTKAQLYLNTTTGALTFNALGSGYVFDAGAYLKAYDISSGPVHPETDNMSQCGNSTHRWTAVYAVNGTIQTSARASKHDIGDVLDAETRKQLKGMKKRYKKNVYIDESGRAVSGTTHEGLSDLLDKIADKLVTFTYDGAEGTRQIGIIADDIADEPEFEHIGEKYVDEVGNISYGLKPLSVTMLAISGYRKQREQIADLTKRIIALESK